MHSPKLSDVDLNLVCRALDTLAEQSVVLKNNIVDQIRSAQVAGQTPPEDPPKE